MGSRAEFGISEVEELKVSDKVHGMHVDVCVPGRVEFIGTQIHAARVRKGHA